MFAHINGVCFILTFPAGAHRSMLRSQLIAWGFAGIKSSNSFELVSPAPRHINEIGRASVNSFV